MSAKITNIILLATTTIIMLIIGEFTLRWLYPFTLNQDERNLSYNHHSQLGWFPKTNLVQDFFGSQQIRVIQNSNGFRDQQVHDTNKPALMFLGDSFVWGYDVENEQIFTSLLQQLQNKYSIYNLGVSGYSTDQEFLLLQQFYQQIKPQTVFLIFTGNDSDGNSRNSNYGYYKPYYQLNGNNLELKGVPVPLAGNYKMLDFDRQYPLLAKSHLIKWSASLWHRAERNLAKIQQKQNPTFAIITNMQQFLQQNNSKLVVGIVDQDLALQQFLQQNNISYIDLQNSMRFPEKGQHWNADGHKFVATKILDYVQQ